MHGRRPSACRIVVPDAREDARADDDDDDDAIAIAGASGVGSRDMCVRSDEGTGARVVARES